MMMFNFYKILYTFEMLNFWLNAVVL